MTPTNKLRFVQRSVPTLEHTISASTTEHTIKETRVLQQWWAPFRTFSDGYGYQTVEQQGGEWRDVPMETEK